MFVNGMRAVHPGEVLREDYLKPLGMSAHALAKALSVPASRINDIVLERRGITPDTALRLTHYFGGKDEDALGWINMQAVFDFKMAMDKISKRIKASIVPRDSSGKQDAAGNPHEYSKHGSDAPVFALHEPVPKYGTQQHT